jgi:chemotaxis protein MotC
VNKRKLALLATSVLASSALAASGLYVLKPELLGFIPHMKPEIHSKLVQPGAKKLDTAIGLDKQAREIFKLQTAMAQGDVNAPDRLRKTMRETDEIISSLREIGEDQHNIDALARYVLSGGNPAPLVKLLIQMKPEHDSFNMLKGIVYYAQADFKNAKVFLPKVNPSEFGSVLEAQLILVQVQLSESDEAPENLKRLSRAANLVPGSLIEEAAIRRMFPFFQPRQDHGPFLYWTTRYFRKFSKSMYYKDFEDNLVEALTAVPKDDQINDTPVLESLLSAAGASKASEFAKRLIENAITDGDSASCLKFESALGEVYDIATPVFASVNALTKACRAAEGDAEVLNSLQNVDVSSFDPTTLSTLQSAIRLAKEVLSSPVQDQSEFMGPHLPLAQTEEFQSFYASVTQQMKVTMSVIKEVDAYESDISQQPGL